jgi:transcription antitermination factor NusG
MKKLKIGQKVRFLEGTLKGEIGKVVGIQRNKDGSERYAYEILGKKRRLR